MFYYVYHFSNDTIFGYVEKTNGSELAGNGATGAFPPGYAHFPHS